MTNSVRILILGMAAFWGISETAGAGQDKDLNKNMRVRLVSVRHSNQRRPAYYVRFVPVRTDVKNSSEFEVTFIPHSTPHERTLLNVILGCVDLTRIGLPDEPHPAILTLILSVPEDADKGEHNDHPAWFVDRLGPLEKEEKK